MVSTLEPVTKTDDMITETGVAYGSRSAQQLHGRTGALLCKGVGRRRWLRLLAPAEPAAALSWLLHRHSAHGDGLLLLLRWLPRHPSRELLVRVCAQDDDKREDCAWAGNGEESMHTHV